jgi:hypothetical protein
VSQPRSDKEILKDCLSILKWIMEEEGRSFAAAIDLQELIGEIERKVK